MFTSQVIWFVFMFFSQTHCGLTWFIIVTLGERGFPLYFCFSLLPCLGFSARGMLMLGALYVRIQSLYSVVFMKHWDKLSNEFGNKLLHYNFHKKGVYILNFFTGISKFFMLLCLSLQIISLSNGWLFEDGLVSCRLT